MMQRNTQATTSTISTMPLKTRVWFFMLVLGVLFLLAACGGSGTGNNPAPTATSGSTNMVTITTDGSGQFAFSPASLTVSVGTTVTWMNSSAAPHTVTSNDGKTFNMNISTGGTVTFKFTQAGTFPY